MPNLVYHKPKIYNLNKKVMVFSFYLTEDFKERRANKIHKFCLNRYSNIFDEIIMTFLIDDVENENLICECEKWLLDSLHCNNITFKVAQNNMLCEGQVFMNEISSKIDELYGLYFFGHNKGVTNYEKYPKYYEEIDLWILGLYYLSLNFMPEVEKELIFDTKFFYGSFLIEDEIPHKENFFETQLIYGGTFFWVNPSLICAFERDGRIPLVTQRGYAESVFVKSFKSVFKTSHNWDYMYKTNQYKHTKEILDYLLNDEEKKEFSSMYDEVLILLKKKLSIITPYYNCLDFIKELASTLEPQLNGDVEWIIVDDGCNETELDTFNARVIHLKENSGCAGVPRNFGLDMAFGEYITFIDADDLVSENFVNEIIKKIDSTNFDYCLFSWKGLEFMYDNNNLDYFKNKDCWNYVDISNCRPEWNVSVWGIVYNKEIIGDNRFTDIVIGEDEEFNKNVLKGKEEKITDILYFYRLKNNGLSQRYS